MGKDISEEAQDRDRLWELESLAKERYADDAGITEIITDHLDEEEYKEYCRLYKKIYGQEF